MLLTLHVSVSLFMVITIHLLLVLSGSYVRSALCLVAPYMGSISQPSNEGDWNLSKYIYIYIFPSVVILAIINELSY